MGTSITPGRARHVHTAILVLVAALGFIALAYGLGYVQLGANAVLLSNWLRHVALITGGVLLGSAFIAAVWPWWRQLQSKLFFSAALFLALFVLAEIAARLAGYPAEPTDPRNSYWIIDPELGYACQPNHRFRFLTPKGWVSGSTDATGHRPSIVGADSPETPAVICLGDSTTFSTEVEDGQTWTEAAGRYLAGRGKTHRMINRGITGYSGVQSLLSLRRTLKTGGNFKAVVYHFCNNDPIENFTSFVPSPLLQAQGDGFEIAPPPRAALASSGFQLRPNSALLTAFRTWRFSTNDHAYKAGAGVGYTTIVMFARRFMEEQQLRDGEHWVLTQMKADCDKHGLPLVVSSVNYPYLDADDHARDEVATLLGMPRSQVDADAKFYDRSCAQMKQIVERAGAKYVDIRGCLKGMGYRDYAASPYDWHFSVEANERIGRAIAEKLEKHLR